LGPEKELKEGSDKRCDLERCIENFLCGPVAVRTAGFSLARLATGTIEDWERTLRNWISPHISDVNNGVLKQLVAAMSKAGLSPKSIENYLQVPKMVVASVTDDDGNQMYPRKWNHEFIDLPIVEQSEQNRPSFSPEIMTGLATYRHPREQMLFVLAGAGGFRIGEALGIEIDKHLSADCSTVNVDQKAGHGRVERRVKSVNAKREVDLHPAIAKLLKNFIDTRNAGFLFETEASDPNQCPSSPLASGVEGTGVLEWAHGRL